MSSGDPSRQELEAAATAIQRKESQGPVSTHDLPLPSAVREGAVLLGRYTLTRPIAEGGMASVWHGRHASLGTEVAVKFTTRFEPAAVARFHQEALLTARLGSINIVQVLDVGVIDEVPFIVMEYLRGETLAERILSRGPIRASDAVTWFAQAAFALEKAHLAGIIHRDVKPSNLFLVDNGRETVLKVLDFGVAKNPEHAQTMAGDFIGTPQYMSLEQALDPRSVDGRSDFWSLAVVVYEAVVGKPAFGPNTAGEILQKIAIRPAPVPSEHGVVPPEFDRWFQKAAARDPDERFASAEAFVAGLKHALLLRQEAAFSRPTSPPAEATGMHPTVPAKLPELPPTGSQLDRQRKPGQGNT